MDVQYKIIGGDGREYGPASLEEMKSWIREGRVAGTTMVWRSDSQSWLPATQFLEFQPEIGAGKGVVPPPQFGESYFETVGFWPRLGAYVIDRIVLGVVFYLIWMVLASSFGWEQTQPPTNGNMEQVMKWFSDDWAPFVIKQMLLYVPLHILYETIMNGRWGATVGKMAIGARVVRLDGSALGYGGAFLRWWGERLSDLTCYIGYLFIAFREDKRALHDLIVSTRVIYKR